MRLAATPNNPWVAEIVLAPQREAVWRQIRAFLVRLDGGVNLVRMFDPFSGYPRGVAAGISRSNFSIPGTSKFSDGTSFTDGTAFRDGSLVANLARDHQRGERNVYLSGLIPSQVSAFLAGDMMEIGGYLYMATSDVKSDSAGKSLVPIMPPLRQDQTVLASGPVNFDHPTSTFVLQSDAGINIDINLSGEIGIQLAEYLP